MPSDLISLMRSYAFHMSLIIIEPGLINLRIIGISVRASLFFTTTANNFPSRHFSPVKCSSWKGLSLLGSSLSTPPNTQQPSTLCPLCVNYGMSVRERVCRTIFVTVDLRGTSVYQTLIHQFPPSTTLRRSLLRKALSVIALPVSWLRLTLLTLIPYTSAQDSQTSLPCGNWQPRS